MLLKNLPPESAYFTAMREAMTNEERSALPEPKGYGPWSNVELLLANIVDGINWLAWQQTMLNRKKGTKAPPKPDPIPRPGVKRKTKSKRTVTPQGIMALHELRVAHAERYSTGVDE